MSSASSFESGRRGGSRPARSSSEDSDDREPRAHQQQGTYGRYSAQRSYVNPTPISLNIGCNELCSLRTYVGAYVILTLLVEFAIWLAFTRVGTSLAGLLCGLLITLLLPTVFFCLHFVDAWESLYEQDYACLFMTVMLVSFLIAPATAVSGAYMPMLRLLNSNDTHTKIPVPQLPDPASPAQLEDYVDKRDKKVLSFLEREVLATAAGTASTTRDGESFTVYAAPLVQPGSKLVSAWVCRPTARKALWSFPLVNVAMSPDGGRADWLPSSTANDALRLSGISSSAAGLCREAAWQARNGIGFANANLTANPSTENALLLQLTDFARLRLRVRIIVYATMAVLNIVFILAALCVAFWTTEKGRTTDLSRCTRSLCEGICE